jgi:hypothetical protein
VIDVFELLKAKENPLTPQEAEDCQNAFSNPALQAFLKDRVAPLRDVDSSLLSVIAPESLEYQLGYWRGVADLAQYLDECQAVLQAINRMYRAEAREVLSNANN